ncbi:MAG TPA: Uma2 family endonuclease [Gemmatimonadaceae bacterium]|nr:Uma2 family endonuclease [Gemmatimonadaceae bacterium]
MPAINQRWTAEMVRALPEDGKRYELIDGELLVSPSPRLVHQHAVGLLWSGLEPYVRSQRVGRAFMSPADIALEPESIVQPDVFVVPLAAGRAPRDWTDIGALLVAAEVLSPSTARYDRVTKRRFYARRNVPEYWVIDADARLIERWRPGEARPDLLDDRLEWLPAAAAEPFVLDLAAYFRAVHEEE